MLFAYVSCPYGIIADKVQLMNYFEWFGAQLIEADSKIIPVSGLSIGHYKLPHADLANDWNFWKYTCDSLIAISSEMHVLMIDGWDKSHGVLAEIEKAINLSIDVTFHEIIPSVWDGFATSK